MQKLSLIFSDTELGAGTPTDDFVEDELLAETIQKNLSYAEKYPLDLILNGDTFDFLKCPYKGKYERHVTEKISLWKLEQIKNAHPLFFETLRECLNTGPRGRIIFITGNHDFDLTFPKVQQRLKELITKEKKAYNRILFPGFEFTDNRIHIEHGSQLDEFFKVNPHTFIYDSPNQIIGEPFLLMPWGYNILCEHYFKIKEKYPLIERLVPRARTIELLPLKLKKDVIIGSFYYVLKSFFYTQFKHWNDRLYRFSLADFKKYAAHMIKGEYELKIDLHAKRKLGKNNFDLISYGHNHLGKLHKAKHKWLLNTGNWRDEYILHERSKKYIPKPKSYGFIIHSPEKIHEVRLIQVASKQRSYTIQEIKDYVRNK